MFWSNLKPQPRGSIYFTSFITRVFIICNLLLTMNLFQDFHQLEVVVEVADSEDEAVVVVEAVVLADVEHHVEAAVAEEVLVDVEVAEAEEALVEEEHLEEEVVVEEVISVSLLDCNKYLI